MDVVGERSWLLCIGRQGKGGMVVLVLVAGSQRVSAKPESVQPASMQGR